MILRFLASTPVLIAVWILGPLVLFLLWRRNKRLAEVAAKPKTAPAPKKERDTGQFAATPVPGMAADVTPGFRDLKWGDAPPEAMERLSESGEESIYHRRSDILRVEDVPVEHITYVFTSKQLAAVRIEAPLHVADPLQKALSARWGAPDTPDPKAVKQQWTHLVSGPMATAAVLERNAVSRRTTLFIFRKAERRSGA